jgi:glycosyltransferase involved in cell wall biosynthesis
MKEKILWIVPSRNRPQKLERFIESFLNCTTGRADLLIGLDSDDHSCDHLIKKYPQLIWEINEPVNGSFLKVLNDMALKYAEEYRWLGFNEDDGIFKSPKYEDHFISKLNELGRNGLVYANDMIGKKRLIYFPVMDSSIIKRLGFFVPPSLQCMYADNFWRDMADHLKSFHYFPELIIQHLHYTREEGRLKDETSASVDSFKKVDCRAYEEYINTLFSVDMEKLK